MSDESEPTTEIDVEIFGIGLMEPIEPVLEDTPEWRANDPEVDRTPEITEKGEDEKPEEKEETLSQFITSNRGGSGEFKLEYEGTFVLSTLTEEQKSAQADLLTSLTANPKQSMMLPDHIDGKITYFTAARMDNEGNLKYEIRSYTEKEEEEEEKPIDKVDGVKVEEATLNLELSIDIDKQEEVDKETILDQSLLAEIEITNEQEVENVEEIVQPEEVNFVALEVNQIGIEPTTIQQEASLNNTIPLEELINIDSILNSEQLVVENVTAEKINVDKESIINTNNEKEINTDISKNVEDKTIENVEKMLTLEDKIRELLGYSNEQTEKVMTNVEEIDNKAEIHETTQASHAESRKEQNTEQVEQIFNAEKVEVNIVEERPEEVVLINEQESKVSEQITIKEVNTDIKVKGSERSKIEQTHIEKTDIVNKKSKEKSVVEAKEKDVNLNTRKVDSAKPEKVIMNNDKDIKLVNTRESKVVAKEATPEKVQVINNKPEKKAKDNVLPFKVRESRPAFKNVEVKATKPAIEKTVAKNEQERTSKSSREALVLNINRNTIKNTIRNEAPISLEKTREERRTTEESLKVKPLDGHEILLQILGISKNGAETKNAEPVNFGSVPNINQEEPEIKSTKSTPNIYQQRTLNGITLKIAA